MLVRFDVRWLAAPLLLGALAVPACGDAELEDDCVTGPCGSATVTTHAVVSTGGGCAVENRGGLPCDVFAILDAHCHKCHQEPPKAGAPFNLLSVDAFEGFYPGTEIPVWRAAKGAIQTTMPFDNPSLKENFPADEATLQAWLATCEDDGFCLREEESGAGGAGGAPPGTGGGGAGG